MLKRPIILFLVLVLVATAYFLSPYRLGWEALNQFYAWIRPWNTVRIELVETRASLQKELDRLRAQLNAAQQQIASFNQQAVAVHEEIQQLAALHDQEIQAFTRSHQQTLNAIEEQLSALRQELEQARNKYVDADQLNDTLAKALAAAAKFHPVNLDLGPLPVGDTEQLTYSIPESIPGTAREILLYVYIATNYVKGDAHNFKLFVNLDGQEENAFYLHAVAFAQQGWSYNSENAWLPMPADRTLRVQSDGKPLFGSWKSLIRIIAYR
ncbi:MAG: hypothetical protein R3F37_14470 [Candidatus Competibacteraceae bacterium]